MPKTTSFTSGLKTASAVIHSNPCYLVGAVLYQNKRTPSSTITLTIYDNKTTSTGTVLAKAVVSKDEKMSGLLFGGQQIRASLGVTAKVAGTSASFIVYPLI